MRAPFPWIVRHDLGPLKCFVEVLDDRSRFAQPEAIVLEHRDLRRDRCIPKVVGTVLALVERQLPYRKRDALLLQRDKYRKDVRARPLNVRVNG